MKVKVDTESLLKSIVILSLYAFACELKASNKTLCYLRKKASKECKGSANNSSKKESNGIGRDFTIPTKNRYRNNDGDSQYSSPSQYPPCCPSCGTHLRFGLELEQFMLGFNITPYQIRDLSKAFLDFGGRQQPIQSGLFRRFLRTCIRIIIKFIHSIKIL